VYVNRNTTQDRYLETRKCDPSAWNDSREENTILYANCDRMCEQQHTNHRFTNENTTTITTQLRFKTGKKRMSHFNLK